MLLIKPHYPQISQNQSLIQLTQRIFFFKVYLTNASTGKCSLCCKIPCANMETVGKHSSTSNSTFLFKPQHSPVKSTTGVSLHLHAYKKPGNCPKSG